VIGFAVTRQRVVAIDLIADAESCGASAAKTDVAATRPTD
jgi:hypothetical protein